MNTDTNKQNNYYFLLYQEINSKRVVAIFPRKFSSLFYCALSALEDNSVHPIIIIGNCVNSQELFIYVGVILPSKWEIIRCMVTSWIVQSNAHNIQPHTGAIVYKYLYI